MVIQKILHEQIIPRKWYLDSIEQYLDTPLIKVLIGQRRVGKSTILKAIVQQLYREQQISITNIFYINKELLDFDHIKTYDDLKELFQSFLATTKP
jgi:predicted AAA+ superfamily ATPase